MFLLKRFKTSWIHDRPKGAIELSRSTEPQFDDERLTVILADVSFLATY